MEKLDIDIICPGHGKVAGKDLLGTQKRYFADLRDHVKKGIDDKKSLEDITSALQSRLVQGVDRSDRDETPMLKDNVKHVYEELTGKIDHDRLGARPAPLDWRGERRPRDRGERAGSRARVSGALMRLASTDSSTTAGHIPAVVFFDNPEKLSHSFT